MSDPSSIKPRFISLVLVGSLAACTNDVVDLGGGQLTQNVEVGSRCAGSPIVDGDVRVENQDELDALLGCEEIRGSLDIQVFEDTDLTPLSQLRAIDGFLSIGTYPEAPAELTPEALEAWQPEYERVAAIADAGWLPSLAGVESLERVGSLALNHVSAPDLQAFQNLRLIIGASDAELMGALSISGAANLVDLSGLDNARGTRSVEVRDNPILESLDGLHLSSLLDYVHIQSNPALADIDALSTLRITDDVYLYGLAIPNVNALANLEAVWNGVALSGNPELTDADALAGLQSVQYLVFENCPELEHLPELDELTRLGSFKAVGNDSLTTISLDLPKLEEARAVFGADSSGVIEIAGNAQLEALELGAGFRAAEVLSVHHNANLANIDIGPLERLDELSIVGNPALTEVALGALQTVDVLSVIGNPALSTSDLRNVRTFESEFIDNADDPPAP